RRAVGDDGISRFHEKERRLTVRVMAHFTGVFGVIAADTVNASDRKRLVALDHGQRDHAGEINGITHLVFSLWSFPKNMTASPEACFCHYLWGFKIERTSDCKQSYERKTAPSAFLSKPPGLPVPERNF